MIPLMSSFCCHQVLTFVLTDVMTAQADLRAAREDVRSQREALDAERAALASDAATLADATLRARAAAQRLDDEKRAWAEGEAARR